MESKALRLTNMTTWDTKGTNQTSFSSQKQISTTARHPVSLFFLLSPRQLSASFEAKVHESRYQPAGFFVFKFLKASSGFELPKHAGVNEYISF